MPNKARLKQLKTELPNLETEAKAANDRYWAAIGEYNQLQVSIIDETVNSEDIESIEVKIDE